jgi:threonine dehydrogenase-like Zn-dependent dehydrogenase
VAHPSQLYPVPDGVSDENALMVEPFAIGLHAAGLGMPAPGETALILGAGTIGLTTLAALRALGFAGRVLMLARHPFQAQAASRLGASEVFVSKSGDAYAWLAEQTGGTVRQPIIGKRVVSGGAHVTFECAGTDSAIDDALRLTHTGGRVILAGVPGMARGVDWTAIFAQELTVTAAHNYNHVEPWGGKTWRAFDLALHFLAGGLDLGWLVTHRYRLADYKRALHETGKRGDAGMIKAVFEFPA